MAIRIGKKKALFYIIIPLLIASGYQVYRLSSFPPVRPHPHEGPFRIDVVRTRPLPIKEALSQGLTGVLVHLEGEVKKARVTKGKLLLLWIGNIKVVAYPFVYSRLDRRVLNSRWLSATGILYDHPRYGWEVILRRPEDLQRVSAPF